VILRGRSISMSFGRRAVVYGEEDLVVGLTAFLAEIGVEPVLCASERRERPSGAAVKAVAGAPAARVRRRKGRHGFRHHGRGGARPSLPIS